MKLNTLKYLLPSLLFGSISGFSQQTLKVNLSTVIRPVTHCASGSLYGITETIPADITTMVAPLKPYMFCQPPRGNNGNQHPFGSALSVSQRLASVKSAVVQIALPDILPGWPYNWPGKDAWLALVRSFITDKLATGRDNQNPSLFGVAKLADVAITTDLENENSTLSTEINCYPNPFNSTIMLNTVGDFQYQLLNQVGQVLETGQSNEKLTFGQEYPKGIYFLKVQQGVKSNIIKLIKE